MSGEVIFFIKLMKRSNLPLLCDPVTREDLILTDAVYDGDEIVSGMLVSPSNRYPIKNGIPRFVNDEGYSDNFGYQWNRWARVQFEDRNVGRPMQGHTEQMFRKSTGFTKGKLRGRTVLDMGCGPGRFSDVASTMGARVVALDYSSAIDVAKDNFKGKDSDILFVQGDCLRMPFKDGSIDYAFTIGVLHHTPSPAAGVQEAHRVVKVGGEFAIRVYRAGGFYDRPSVRFWRNIFQGLKPIFGHYPPLVYSYLFGSLIYFLGRIWKPLGYLLRPVIPTVWSPDYQWSILDTFDAVATTHQSGHTTQEIESWLQESGFTEWRQIMPNNYIAQR